jgi:hypothetical protein
VVLRGSGGVTRRQVNVPWVRGDGKYSVTGLFTGKAYGTFRGTVLRDQGVPVELTAYGQELLELSPPK